MFTLMLVVMGFIAGYFCYAPVKAKIAAIKAKFDELFK